MTHAMKMQSTFHSTKWNGVTQPACSQAWEETKSAPRRSSVSIAELWLDWWQDNNPNSPVFLRTLTSELWPIQCYHLARRTADGTKRSTGCRVASDSHCGATRLPVVSAFSKGPRPAARGGRSRDSCRRLGSSER